MAPHLLGSGAPLVGRRAALATGAAVLAMVAVAWLDYATGPRLDVELLYLLPVAIVTVLLGRRAGLGMTVASTCCWLLADVALQRGHVDRGVTVWNLVIRSSMFCLIVVLLSALRAARTQAEASSQRSKEFLAMAAHQLRTPIAGMRASAEASLLRGNADVDEALLAHVASEAARAGTLIASLLRMARLDDGVPPPSGTVDVMTLVHAEAERWRARHRELCVVVSGPPGPVGLTANREALSDALANLFDNATRHARTTINVTVRRTRSMVEIEIADDGPGLPLGAEDRAFDRFVSLDGGGGAGLGLAIARSLVESLGGTLSWASDHFALRFPRKMLSELEK